MFLFKMSFSFTENRITIILARSFWMMRPLLYKTKSILDLVWSLFLYKMLKWYNEKYPIRLN